MGSIFKNIGKGIGYFFMFPGLVVAIALYAVFGLIVFIFQFFKLIFLFFTGRNLFSDLPEDIELKALQSKGEETKEEEIEKPLSLYPSDSIVYGSGYSSPAFSEQKEETPNEENVDKNVSEVEVEEEVAEAIEEDIEEEGNDY